MGMKPFDDSDSRKSKHNGMTWEWHRNLTSKFVQNKIEEGYSFEKIMKNMKAGAEKGKEKADKPERFEKTKEVASVIDECKNSDGTLNLVKMEERLDELLRMLKNS